MANDIVIDTNVFMHADDPRAPQRQSSSRDLLGHVDQNKIPICIDSEARVLTEYRDYLQSSPIGRHYVTKWISQKNYVVTNTKICPSDSRWIGKNVKDTVDKVFLKLAIASVEQDLVSHDFEDFSKRKRKEINERFGVSVQTAEEYL